MEAIVAAGNETVLSLRGVGRQLPSGEKMLTILDDVRLDVRRGESLAVLGPSGSGKSTLLALMAGLDRPSSGEVWLDGERIDALSEDELARLRRTKIGFVFQSFQLLGNLTARENVLLPMELLRERNARQRVDELLREVGLSERGHHYPSQLSGGEQQRVALARAFAPRPALLLADEPTGNLDRENGRRVLDLLLELRDHEAVTLLLVTHDLEIGARAGRQIHLDGGRLVRDEVESADDSARAESSGGPPP